MTVTDTAAQVSQAAGATPWSGRCRRDGYLLPELPPGRYCPRAPPGRLPLDRALPPGRTGRAPALLAGRAAGHAAGRSWLSSCGHGGSG